MQESVPKTSKNVFFSKGNWDKSIIRILESTLSMHHNIRRLTTIKARRDLSMLLLTFMTSSRGLSLARCWTTTASNTLVVGPRSVGDGSQDVSIAGLLELREEEGKWC